MNATLCRCFTPRLRVHCNNFSVVCHHFENEWLKIAPTILDLATVSEGEDVLQLAKRFPSVTIEPPWIRVCTHTHTHLYAKTTHTHTDTLILTTWQACPQTWPGNAGQRMTLLLCQQRPPSTEVGDEGGTATSLCLSATNKNRKPR